MSLILDALRKLDREKSSRRHGPANIAVEILRSDPSRPAKKMLRYVAAVSITAVATACITYALVARTGILSRSFPSATVNPPQSQQVTAAVPPRDILSKSTLELSQAPVKIQGSVKSEESSMPPSAEKAGQGMLRKKADVVQKMIKKSTAPTPKVSVAPTPSLKLSGIIWQEEPSERRAMINGRIATEGSIIEGVKVVEIQPARVRFSHNGRFFQISLGQ